MSIGQHHHVSYLLRLWQVKSRGHLIWRASLQNPDTGERTGFANLSDLAAFLLQHYGDNVTAEPVATGCAETDRQDATCDESRKSIEHPVVPPS